MRRYILPLLSTMMISLLAGCGISTGKPAVTAGAAINGTVFGGQQPISGSRIYLMAIGTGGYGTASTSMLTSGIAGTDAIGAYVMSGPGGSFSVTGDYTCTLGQQIYLLVMGGDPTGQTSTNVNSAIGLMSALGSCPASGTLAVQLPNVVVNEATTVAAGYALAGFATDALHISSSGSPQALIGVANAIRTAANLVSPVSGSGYATTPVGGGTPPLAKLNTLANILATCIDSTGNTSTGCTQLFSLAKSNGATGATPSDTATAIINIAHHPGTNTASLYAAAPAAAAFQPSLGSQPNDFSLGIVWPIASQQIAFDSAGNLWTVNGGLLEYSNNGALLSPAAGFTGGGIVGGATGSAGVADLIAIDPGDNVWATSYNTTGGTNVFVNSYLSKFSNAGVALSPSTGFTGGSLYQPSALAIDGSGTVWAGNGGNGALTKMTNSGSPATAVPIGGAGLAYAESLAIDNGGNAWIATVTAVDGSGTNALTKFSNAGAQINQPYASSNSRYANLSVDVSSNLWGTVSPLHSAVESIFQLASATALPVSGFPVTGNASLQQCIQTQIDGNGNLWCASDNDSIAEMSSTGVSLSPPAGYLVPNIYGPEYLAIDSSGNVWTTYNYDPNIDTKAVELVGAAAPW